MKCPCCNQLSGGKTFGDEWDKFRDLLHNTWQEGMRAALLDTTMTKDSCRGQCPYNFEKEIVLWYTWVGGAYHGICWRFERPDEVAQWLVENEDL